MSLKITVTYKTNSPRLKEVFYGNCEILSKSRFFEIEEIVDDNITVHSINLDEIRKIKTEGIK